MTKFRVLSDLHLDFSSYEVPMTDDEQNTVLLLAGDICEAQRRSAYVPFFEDVCDRFKAVVYVFGNHEFYHDSYTRAHVHFNRHFQHDKLYVLDDSCIEVDNVVIAGATLWTDLHRGNPLVVHAVKYGMNDYDAIRCGPVGDPYAKRLDPIHTMGANKKSERFLFETAIQARLDKKQVVFVTHMGPTWQSVPERFKHDTLSYAYVNQYDEMLLEGLGPDVWVHGHTHTAVQYDVGETKVICNPRGYHTSKYDESTGFNPTLTFTVEAPNEVTESNTETDA